jgi:hypothetical protein
VSARKRIVIGTDGYYTQQSPLSTPPGALVYPSKNMIYRENGVLESFGGDGLFFSNGDDRSYALEDGWGILATGNVIESFNRSLIFAGSGTLQVYIPVVNALVQSIGSASSIPQIAVLNGTSDGWLAPRQMGLSPQGTAPVLAEPSTLGSGFAGKITGSISAAIARRRASTGALSIVSPISNVIELTSKSVLVTIPSAPSDGTTHWRLYFTEHGGGSLGNLLQFPVEITEADVAAGTVNGVYGNAIIKSTGTSRVLEVEYYDNDLLPLKPENDFFPAEACDFVEKLGNYTLLIGTHKGLGIWPSIANNPEAFSPLDVQFLPEPVIGVLKPQDGYLWILCRNSIHIVMLAGSGDGATIFIRPVYQKKGVKISTAAVTIGDELYFMSSGGMPCRITADGEYDDNFSLPVRGYFNSWNMAQVVCCYDENANVILYAHAGEVMLYHIDYNKWSPPIVNVDLASPVAGNIKSGFTQEGQAILIYKSGSTYNMYLFDYAGGGSNWNVTTAEFGFDEPLAWKDILGCQIVYNKGSLGAGVSIPFSFSGYLKVINSYSFNTTAISGDEVTKWIPVNVIDFKTTRFAASGSGRAFRLSGIEVDLVTHNIR